MSLLRDPLSFIIAMHGQINFKLSSSIPDHVGAGKGCQEPRIEFNNPPGTSFYELTAKSLMIQ